MLTNGFRCQKWNSFWSTRNLDPYWPVPTQDSRNGPWRSKVDWSSRNLELLIGTFDRPWIGSQPVFVIRNRLLVTEGLHVALSFAADYAGAALYVGMVQSSQLPGGSQELFEQTQYWTSGEPPVYNSLPASFCTKQPFVPFRAVDSKHIRLNWPMKYKVVRCNEDERHQAVTSGKEITDSQRSRVQKCRSRCTAVSVESKRIWVRFIERNSEKM